MTNTQLSHMFPGRLTTAAAAVLIGAAGLLVGMAPIPGDQIGETSRIGGTPPIPSISSYVGQELVLPAEVGAPFDVRVRLDVGPVDLELAPFTIRSPDFKVFVQGDDGLREMPAPPPVTYRGSVKGHPESLVAASLFQGKLTAMIVLSGDLPDYYVQPASDLVEAWTGDGDHVTFRGVDAHTEGDFRCGADDLPSPATSTPGREDLAGADGTGLSIVEIACDADVQFYVQNGASVPATIADIENVLNVTESVYERDVSIVHELTAIIVRSSFAENPYNTSDAESLLNQFRSEWQTAPEAFIKRDIAQLFTGRNLDGGTIGIAWTPGVCTGGNAYSLVQSRFTSPINERAALSCHEFGHNWAAGHCSGSGCHIMCPTHNQCGGVLGVNFKFGLGSIQTISLYRQNQSCDAMLPEPQTVPFLDEFPSLTIDGDKWTWWNSGTATVVDDAVNEPSAPYSVQIRSIAGLENRYGELRSNQMLMLDETDIITEFYTQHIGVEAGEQLAVEYYSLIGSWQPITTVTSDGVDQTDFTFHIIPLPGGAYHDRFRIRFRAAADQDADDMWYVDDVYIGPFIFKDCPEDIDGSGDVGFTDVLAVLAAFGPCPGCPEDIDDDDVVGFTDLLGVLSAWGPCP